MNIVLLNVGNTDNSITEPHPYRENQQFLELISNYQLIKGIIKYS